MRVVALLRGVNLGNRRIAMSELRGIVEGLGHTDVETYLQSGNVVFTPGSGSEDDLADSLAAAITKATGHEVPIVVRTGEQLRKVLATNPYPVDDPTRVVVAFLGNPVDLEALDLGDPAAYRPDELTLVGEEIYVSVPNGQARSKLMERLTARRLVTTLTVRNWRTVTALAGLADRGRASS